MQTQAVIRVALADRPLLLARALSLIVEEQSDMVVSGMYPDSASLLRGLETKPVDVLVLDPIEVSPAGMEIVPHIINRHPEVKIIVLTTQLQEALLFAAIRAGAGGFLLKSSSVEDVLAAIRAIPDSETVLTLEQGLRLLRDSSRAIVSDTGLTRRERDVLAGIIHGYTNQQIGRHLGLAEKTVKNRVSTILSKMDACSRTEAAIRATTAGLVWQGDWPAVAAW